MCGIGIKTMMKHLTIIIAFLMTLSSPVAAQNFDKGLVAHNLEDYATALKEWTPLAKTGNAMAQAMLGSMYRMGEGVLQNNIIGYMWSNISSANGYKDGATIRDLLAEKMSPLAIEKAQAMARECMSSNYKKCGY